MIPLNKREPIVQLPVLTARLRKKFGPDIKVDITEAPSHGDANITLTFQGRSHEEAARHFLAEISVVQNNHVIVNDDHTNVTQLD